MVPDSIERREDLDTRGRVADVLFAVVQDRKRTNRHIRFVERAVAVMGVTVLATCISIFGIPFTPVEGLLAANNQRAAESKKIASANTRLVAAIQAERERNIRRTCEANNAQADRQNAALTRFGANHAIRQLVAAILPQRHNCSAVVRQQIPSATRKTSKASEAP